MVDDLPPVLYVACLNDDGTRPPRAMVLGLDDGRRALLAYTSLDRLQRHAGDDQAWALTPVADLGSIAAHDVLLLDARVPGRGPLPEGPRPIVGPMLYLPVRDDGTTAEIRRLKDGRRGLLAYTALDRLERCCGPSQRWTTIRTADLGDLRARQPFDVVVPDMEVPERFRRDGRIA